MSFERPRARSLLPLLFVVSCSIFFSACRPKKEHPGCPGESFRSARSDVDCVCDDDEVLKAGNLECEACDPFPSGGAYCECRDVPAVLSFDSRLDVALGVTSEQVTCGPRTECPIGQRKDEASDACVACAALECGASCGGCPVGQSCVSGQCFPVAVCVIQPDDALSYECTHGPGDIVDYIPESGFPEGARCDFTQEMCDYTGIIEPLVPFDTTGCPGESSFEDGVCACPDGKVLGAGALECKDCEPEASGEAYCDCGENAVFSFDGRIDWSLGLASEQVACREPSECPDGQRRAPDSEECIACGALDCGTGCGLCDVGSTCISGTCVAAAACRVEEVVQSAAGLPCSYEVGELAGFGLLSTVPSGNDCAVTPGDSCTYYGTSEVLSK
jgi:hypothetical protein